MAMNALSKMAKPKMAKVKVAAKPMKAKTAHHGKNLGGYLHPKKARHG